MAEQTVAPPPHPELPVRLRFSRQTVSGANTSGLAVLRRTQPTILEIAWPAIKERIVLQLTIGQPCGRLPGENLVSNFGKAFEITCGVLAALVLILVGLQVGCGACLLILGANASN